MAILRLENTADTFFEEGQKALEREDYPRAIAEFSRAVKEQPNNLDFLNALAGAYGEGGALKESSRIFIRMLSMIPRLSYVQEVGRNLIADGKQEESENFVASALASVKELSVDGDNLEQFLKYHAMGFNRAEEGEDAEIEEPDFISAKTIREEELYREILAAEHMGDYPGMMRLALTYRKEYAYYTEVLELITHHMRYTFRDKEGAKVYAEKLRERCPESAAHFDVLYPETPDEDKPKYLDDTVTAILQFGYPDDMELLVKCLAGLKEYEAAKRCNERFLNEIPYRESLWKNKVCLAFLLNENGDKVLSECERAFPFAPFVNQLKWAAACRKKTWWREILAGLPVGFLEMEEELRRFSAGLEARNRFATDFQKALALLGVAFRTYKDADLSEVIGERWREKEGFYAFLRNELRDPDVLEGHKEKILYCLLDAGYAGTVTVVAYGHICRSLLKPLPAEAWKNPRSADIYRRLTVNLFMSTEKVNTLCVAAAVKRIDDVADWGNRRMASLTAAAHSFYFDLTNREDIFLEEIAEVYGLKTDTLQAIRAYFSQSVD